MASYKISKLAGAKPVDEFELNIAQALVDLENNVPELKKDLRPLTIASAKEVRNNNSNNNTDNKKRALGLEIDRKSKYVYANNILCGVNNNIYIG